MTSDNSTEADALLPQCCWNLFLIDVFTVAEMFQRFIIYEYNVIASCSQKNLRFPKYLQRLSAEHFLWLDQRKSGGWEAFTVYFKDRRAQYTNFARKQEERLLCAWNAKMFMNQQTDPKERRWPNDGRRVIMQHVCRLLVKGFLMR